MAGAKHGKESRLAIAGQEMEFDRFIDRSIHRLKNGSERSIVGTLDLDQQRVVADIQQIRFSIYLFPTITDLDTILDLLGMTEATDVWTNVDTLSSFAVILDRVAKVHTYGTVYVARAIFRAKKGVAGSRMLVQLDCVAIDPNGVDAESEGNAGTFSATAPVRDDLYTFTEGVLLLDGNSEAFNQFVLMIDFGLALRHNWSVAPRAARPTQRTTYLMVNSPYTSDETALYTTPSGGDASGITGRLTFTRGARSTQFDLGNCKAEAKPPDVLKGEKIWLPLTYRVYKDGATPALKVTHDNTV